MIPLPEPTRARITWRACRGGPDRRPSPAQPGLFLAAFFLILTFVGGSVHAAPDGILYRLWLLDVGEAPIESSALLVQPENRESSNLPPLLAHGLLLSAGYLLLPVEDFQALASQLAGELLDLAGPDGGLVLQGGVQDGRVSVLATLAAYPGRPGQFTVRRALAGSDWELIPADLGTARVSPILSSLLFQVEPHSVGTDGRVLTEVQFEVEHEGRLFRYEASLPLGARPTPIAGLLIRRNRALNLGPLPIEQNQEVRLAALAVTAEPPPVVPACTQGSAEDDRCMTTTASFAPFLAHVADWFGPLPQAPKPAPVDTHFGISVVQADGRSDPEMNLSWRWSDAFRLTLHGEAARPQVLEHTSRPWGWVGLHTTLARRLELAALAVLGPHPLQVYGGMTETTRLLPHVDLSASYFLDLTGGGLSLLFTGQRPGLEAFDPVWNLGARWQSRPWQVELGIARPPGDVEQVSLRAARLADGQEDQRLAAGLEAGVTYRWPLDHLQWRVGLRMDVWE